MNNYKVYPKYKNAEIEWLGEIPEHWDEKPLNSICSVKSVKNQQELQLLSVFLNEGVIRFTDVAKKRTNVTSLDLSNYQRVDPGDFVLNNQQAWRGSVGVSAYTGLVSPAYIVLKLANNLDHCFANYLFRDQIMITHYLRNSKGVGTIQRNLYWPNLKRSIIPIPPKQEQTAIAQFLTKKTTEIARFIALKEKTIALLKERKTAIINQAVTCGLDKNGKLREKPEPLADGTLPEGWKDSGIEWLGVIPKHWEVTPLSYLGKNQNGISKDSDYFGSGHPFISYGDVYNHRILPRIKGLAKSSKSDRMTYSIIEGDILFTRTSETIDEIGFASVCLNTISNATFSGFLIRFRPFKNRLIPDYSKYYFRSNLHRKFFVREMNIVIRASLSQNLLKKMPVVLPPLTEQSQISDYLDEKVKNLNLGITETEKEITLIKEYRESLISEAVTGKIDIRNV